ncbi:unnamed protein product [Musa hybrid cultivar]
MFLLVTLTDPVNRHCQGTISSRATAVFTFHSLAVPGHGIASRPLDFQFAPSSTVDDHMPPRLPSHANRAEPDDAGFPWQAPSGSLRCRDPPRPRSISPSLPPRSRFLDLDNKGCAANQTSEAEDEGRRRRGQNQRPAWLEQLLSTDFFGPCEAHKDIKKSEINIYCVDCRCSMCANCLSLPSSPHRRHRRLQIRRYVYQDVVRVLDIHKLLDCSKVQSYTVNSAKVLFLHPRNQSKSSKPNPGSPLCNMCSRSVAEPNRYCSVACKVFDDSKDASTAPVDESDRSEPCLPHLTSDFEDEPDAEASDASQDGSPDSPRPGWRTRVRKGVPQRSPFF